MKNLKSLVSTVRFSLVLIVLAAMVNACQNDLDKAIEGPEEAQVNRLKNYQIQQNVFGGYYSGGEWLLVLPEGWELLDKENRNLLIYAHGIVDPDEDPALPDDHIAGRSIAEIVVGMNWAFATTSYRETGLVVKEAVTDVMALQELLSGLFDEEDGEIPAPGYTFLTGVSEGGLVTVKAIEANPGVFNGAISTCAPIGNFYKQLQYNGDFHVLFNYFFKHELKKHNIDLGDPTGVASQLLIDWKKDDVLKNTLKSIMLTHPDKTVQLIKCAKVTVNVTDPDAAAEALLDVLRFNVMFTNDVNERLGGVIFNNVKRWYIGSDNDWLLNRQVQRIKTASYSDALMAIADYETSGRIATPLVTMHTTFDHVVPFWHQLSYRVKVWRSGSSGFYTGLPVINYGHCTFSESHVMAAITIMYLKATASSSYLLPSSAFSSEAAEQQLKSICNEAGFDVKIEGQ